MCTDVNKLSMIICSHMDKETHRSDLQAPCCCDIVRRVLHVEVEKCDTDTHHVPSYLWCMSCESIKVGSANTVSTSCGHGGAFRRLLDVPAGKITITCIVIRFDQLGNTKLNSENCARSL
jgi:hypothetical protein